MEAADLDLPHRLPQGRGQMEAESLLMSTPKGGHIREHAETMRV
jgi:hypothetical protein